MGLMQVNIQSTSTSIETWRTQSVLTGLVSMKDSKRPYWTSILVEVVPRTCHYYYNSTSRLVVNNMLGSSKVRDLPNQHIARREQECKQSSHSKPSLPCNSLQLVGKETKGPKKFEMLLIQGKSPGDKVTMPRLLLHTSLDMYTPAHSTDAARCTHHSLWI